MTHPFSILLDLCRITASFCVALAHSSYVTYNGQYKNYFVWAGHPAVIVFFVLSGYVIAFSCYRKHEDFSGYLSIRISRLFPVYYFALLLTPILDFLANRNRPFIYSWKNSLSSLDIVDAARQFILSVLLMQQSDLGVSTAKWFSNGPLWSISYEFVFYIVFGIFFFVKSPFIRIITSIVCVCFFARILILFPVWLLGVLAFYVNFHYIAKNNTISHYKYLLAAVFSLSALLLLSIPSPISKLIHTTTLKIQLIGDYSALGPSQSYIYDLLMGIAVCALFISCFGFIEKGKLSSILQLSSVERRIRKIASSTYTTYVLHVPLIIFISSFHIFDISSLTDQAFILAITFAVCYFTSKLIEKPGKYLCLKLIGKLKLHAQ